MKVAFKAAAAALVLFASVPVFAHGGMGHMGGNTSGTMGRNPGSMSQQMVIGNRGDHHMHWRYTKTTKQIRRTRTRPKTLTAQNVIRIKQEVLRLNAELVKLKAEGRSNSFLARRLMYRVTALTKLIKT